MVLGLIFLDWTDLSFPTLLDQSRTDVAGLYHLNVRGLRICLSIDQTTCASRYGDQTSQEV